MDERQQQGFSFLRLKDKLVENKKNVATFCALLVVASLVLGGTVFFINSRLATITQVIGFAVLGYMHVSIMERKLDLLKPSEKLVYSLLLTAVVFLFVSLPYFFTNTYRLLIIFAASCAFLLVYVLRELWLSYVRVSESGVKPWHFSGNPASNQATVFLNSIPITVKIQIEQQGRVQYVLAFRAPIKMKLGMIFYHVLKEHNETGKALVDLFDENEKPYAWVFFRPSLAGWSKSLDPEATLIESKISPNSVIIARRLPENVFSEASDLKTLTV